MTLARGGTPLILSKLLSNMQPCEGPGIWHNNLLQYVKKVNIWFPTITPPSLCYMILLLNPLFIVLKIAYNQKCHTSHDGICQRACQKMVVLGLLTFEYTKFHQQAWLVWTCERPPQAHSKGVGRRQVPFSAWLWSLSTTTDKEVQMCGTHNDPYSAQAPDCWGTPVPRPAATHAKTGGGWGMIGEFHSFFLSHWIFFNIFLLSGGRMLSSSVRERVESFLCIFTIGYSF